jgi:ribosomal protein L7/L12
MEPPNSPDQSELVKKALLAGKKIEAIRLYREQYKVGLAEAKAAVEAMELGTGARPTASALGSTDHPEAIRAALLAGKKIEAILLYREQYKVGLAEANAAVEALELGTRVLAASALASTEHTEAIRAALLAGKKIEAVRLYRVQNKVGLAEAKAAVDAMETQIRGLMPGSSNPVQSGGCFGMVAIGVLAVVAVWKVLA